MMIRAETPADHDAVREITRAAFGREPEAKLVDLARAKLGDRAISLVAEQAGNGLTGHILLTPAKIESKAGTQEAAGMALGPVSVAPSVQRSGIGSALCRSALSCAQARGAPFVIVLGHPAYYPRFGFVPAAPLGIACPYEGVPEAAFMIARLDRAAMGGIAGTARFDPLFETV
ncbi:MAG: N-acetyltransferase [Oceanicaulis sp.]|uniref:GNAT family N-acetyltransferase n=1 Tax=Glycocaulis sp. TaxID=1969725 RepID=UPI0025C079AE|nr:N-acetyltransferase [Glycocaulis sp.]MCC5980779.1 N-acetyltransferase [Oceanicaulis sp.]MCH8521023.1 N-acetyltransferase [Glycocaulis sp.]